MLSLLSVCWPVALLALVCWFLGGGLLRLARLPALPLFLSVFLRLVLGLSLLLTGYALVRTTGNTVLAGLILLLGGMLWQLRRAAAPAGPAVGPGPATGAAALGLAVAVAVGMTALRFPMLYNFGTGYFDAPFLDLAYYAKLTFPLNQQGVETVMLEPTNVVRPVPVPYHYFELWLNALLEWATPLAPTVSLFVATYSFMLTLVFFGYCTLFEHFEQPRGRVLLLGALCMFLTGILLPGFERSTVLWNNRFALLAYLAVFPKLASVYIFTLLGFALYVRRQLAAAFWAWAVIPVVFISTAPALFGSLAVLATGLTIAGRRGRRYWQHLLLPVVVSAGFIGAFYLINAWLHPSAASTPLGSSLRALLPRAGEWRTSLNVAVGGVLAFVAYYFLYGLVLLAAAWPRWRQAAARLKPYAGLLGLVLGYFAIGLPLWGLGYHFLDAWQFFNNAVMAGVAALFATGLAVVLRGRGPRPAYLTATALGGLILLNLYSAGGKLPLHVTVAYDPAFLARVNALLPVLSPAGAYVLGPDDYDSPYAYNAYTRTPGLYLNTLEKQSRVLLNLSQLSVDTAQAAANAANFAYQTTDLIERTQIRQFARQLRVRQPTLSDAAIQRRFVLSQQLNFVCVAPSGQLPASLQALVRQQLEDPQTHEKLYLLNVNAPQGP